MPTGGAMAQSPSLDPANIERVLKEAHAKFASITEGKNADPTTSPPSRRCRRSCSASPPSRRRSTPPATASARRARSSTPPSHADRGGHGTPTRGVRMTHRLVAVIACVGLLCGGAARGASDKPPTKKGDKDLEQRVEQQDKVIRDLEKRIDELEGSPKTPPPVAAPPAPKKDEGAPAAAEDIEAKMFPKGHQTPVENR